MPRDQTVVSSSPNEHDVLREIEQAVLDRRLTPGTKLKEVQLAELFGVKRGMIRKVLARLAHSKLVEQTPNCGSTVAKPSLKEGQDLFAARRVIEFAILEQLVASADQNTIKRLRKVLELEQKAYQQNKLKKALSLSIDFHQLLAHLAGNRILEGYLNDILHRTPLVLLTHLTDEPKYICHNHHHQAVVDAIANKDLKTAQTVMDKHLLQLEKKMKPKIENPTSDLTLILSRPQ